MKIPSPAVALFRELTSVPTAPFFEQAVTSVALSWIKKTLGACVKIQKCRGGVIVRYRGAGAGPALALAAHLDHPAFHLSKTTGTGATAALQGGLLKELLPGAVVEAFSARPSDNRPLARGVLGSPAESNYPVAWTQAPRPGVKLAFATLALTPFKIEGKWLLSRSIDDLLGCAVSLEALRQAARAKLKTNLTVLLHRAEEVGFIGALDLIKTGAVKQIDSILSIETSKHLQDAMPGRGPVIRTGDKSTLFDPNLVALLDEAGAALKARGLKIQRARLTGGSCEATAYLSYGYETAGVAIPLVNYHNGGNGKVEPEKVRLEDVDAAVGLLVETARRFPGAVLRGALQSRLSARHQKLSPSL